MYKGLLVCLLIFAFTRLSSQDKMQPSPQAGKGIEAFKQGQYKTALTEFRNLLIRYPKDPLYIYYTGASLLMSNSDISQGLELLKSAAEKNVPHEVFYYMGLCYYRLYQFETALQYYTRYKEEASISKLVETNINQEIQRVKFVPPYLKTISIPMVVSKTTAIDSQSMYSALPSVSLLPCPSYAMGCNKIFLWNGIKTGEFAYYSAYRAYKLRGKELYKIRKLGTENWSDSEAIGSLNSMQDEDFPFFDKKNQTLYFCSKGYQGFGGYDIYKSSFDSVKNIWTKPENLGFPVNTPFDDIIYLRDETTGVTTLVSNRDCERGSFIVYQLMNDIIYKTKDVLASQELIDASRLTVNAKEKDKLQFARTSSLKKTEPKQESKTTDPARTLKENCNEKKLPVSKYIETITKGLQLQAECDSILKISDALRLQASSTPDDTERGKLQKQITILDMQAKDLQATADKYYAIAREMELENTIQPKVPVFQKPREDEKVKTKTEERNEKDFQFEILASSPYSEKNPIPFDVPLPLGVLYKIQVAAINKVAAPDQFGGIKPITAEHMSDGVIIKYYVGWFTSFADADLALRKVQDKGYKQAFIVAFYNGTKLPLNRAKQMEKEE